MQEMVMILIDTIQLESGIGSLILEDTQTLDYLEWGWIPQIREFLNHINGKITVIGNKPPLFREGNHYIMDSPTLLSCSYKERMLIHQCRIYLQVKVLSDITNDKGDCIVDASWKNNDKVKTSKCLKKWPLQADPGKEAWLIWKQFLHRAYKNSIGTLQKPLGNWTQQNKFRIHLHYYNPEFQTLYCYDDQLWRKHAIRTTT
jgi:hypothetical protein